jgi:hypothetical protein
MGSNPIAIVIAGALIALAIALTNHWEMTSTADGNYRLNRWTGAIDPCFPEPMPAGWIRYNCDFRLPADLVKPASEPWNNDPIVKQPKPDQP